MKKFIRNLLSGYLLIIFILLIELGVMIYVQFFLDDTISKILGESDSSNAVKLILMLSYIFLKLALFIIEVVIFFKIINKQEDPEFKIPWIVGMLLLPFFCAMLFLIFGNHGLKKKDRKVLDETIKVYKKNTLEANDETIFENSIGAFNYLSNTTQLAPHTNNKVTYYKCGSEFFPELYKCLKEAKEFIFMEFFIVHDGTVWSTITEILKEKAQEGVKIIMIYDDMGCSGTISARTPKILGKYGIECHKFHPFRPILSGVYNNRDHRKIAIIDHKYGFTGGMNLGDEYANLIERFGYWKDTMIKIQGSAINNLIETFLQNYSLCTYKVSDYNKYLTYDYEKYEDNGYVMPFGDGPGGIDDALVGEQNYINILHYAKHEVYISTPYLVPTYELLDSLRNAALRGVKVHLILPGIPDKKLVYKVAQSNFPYLLEAGVNIYTYKKGFNHMKTILADEKLGFVGTINYDFRSLVHHFECGALMYKVECLKDIKADFLEMLSESEQVPKDFKLSKGTRRFCNIVKLISPLL